MADVDEWDAYDAELEKRGQQQYQKPQYNSRDGRQRPDGNYNSDRTDNRREKNYGERVFRPSNDRNGDSRDRNSVPQNNRWGNQENRTGGQRDRNSAPQNNRWGNQDDRSGDQRDRNPAPQNNRWGSRDDQGGDQRDRNSAPQNNRWGNRDDQSGDQRDRNSAPQTNRWGNRDDQNDRNSAPQNNRWGNRDDQNDRNSAPQNNRWGNRDDQTADQGGNNRWANNQQDSDKSEVLVPSSLIGKVIGRSGATIKLLQTTTGAQIKVPRNDSDADVPVAVYGTKEQRDQAVEKIKDIIEDKPDDRRKGPEKKALPMTSDGFVDWDQLKKNSEKAQKERWEKHPPIKLNFYNEDPQVANFPPEYVAKIRARMNNVAVKNTFKEEHIPNPVETFEQAFRDYPDIMREIKKQRFTEPSPIQAQGWPILLSGRDLIGIAQTGTGKTLAFLLPALIHIDGQPIPREERGGANVLIIAPTRELALQIEQEVNKYSYKGIRSVCVYGGAHRRAQVDKVEAGVEIIIATPGRLNDLISDGIIDVSCVTYLILDEADRMLDMGFEPQIRKTLLDIRPDRQAVMTSATWPSGVRSLAEKYMNNPVQVVVGSLDLAACHSVTQTIVIIPEEEKTEYLMEFLENLTPEDKVMVFVGRKTTADEVSSNLALAGVVAQCIHGDRDQQDREDAIRELKSGEVRILIATDVASRGIDINDVTKVFNMDFPRNIEEYVHRVGRTGRAGKTGEAISLFTRKDWAFAKDLIDILEEASQLVPEELYQMKERFEAMKARRDQEKQEGRGRDDRGGFGGGRDRGGFGGDGGEFGGFGGGGRGRGGGRGGNRGGRW